MCTTHTIRQDQPGPESNGHPDGTYPGRCKSNNATRSSPLRGNIAPVKLRCSGRSVRGELGADSDIDFLVEFEAGYKLRDHIRLTQGLQKLLGRRVEVVDRGSLREELRATILAEAQSL